MPIPDILDFGQKPWASHDSVDYTLAILTTGRIISNSIDFI